jgi:hypothetical protein
MGYRSGQFKVRICYLGLGVLKRNKVSLDALGELGSPEDGLLQLTWSAVVARGRGRIACPQLIIRPVSFCREPDTTHTRSGSIVSTNKFSFVGNKFGNTGWTRRQFAEKVAEVVQLIMDIGGKVDAVITGGPLTQGILEHGEHT